MLGDCKEIALENLPVNVKTFYYKGNKIISEVN